MAYEIILSNSAVGELKAVRPYDRRRIVDAIDMQLAHEPTVVTRNRKALTGIEPDFEHVEPIWELRVHEFRVFYDVDQSEQRVFVRAIRHKESQTTEDVIR